MSRAGRHRETMATPKVRSPGGTAGVREVVHLASEQGEDVPLVSPRQDCGPLNFGDFRAVARSAEINADGINGAALGRAASLFLDAHRLIVAGLVLVDEAGLELVEDVGALAESLGTFATRYLDVVDAYGHARAAHAAVIFDT